MAMTAMLENGDKRSAEYEMMFKEIISFNAAAYRMERSAYQPFVNLNYDPLGVH
eukprot:CAMPEP_0115010328 /NCGR_PEP_ID=MMETSP0216-20121206/23241_1 /TAXON_ID=223996 /ORGANISM="Protocruzia adherens, Strain Boccale" /LENGTH=53 /DNA_ID=CAMNT_0002378503 /DNA_START=1 /DNA_END=159 /DNA_ORIENTATION=-